MTILILGLVLIAVTFSALAQVSFKAGMYGANTFLWLLVLSRLEVTVAYPFVGLGFVVIMLLRFSASRASEFDQNSRYTPGGCWSHSCCELLNRPYRGTRS